MARPEGTRAADGLRRKSSLFKVAGHNAIIARKMYELTFDTDGSSFDQPHQVYFACPDTPFYVIPKLCILAVVHSPSISTQAIVQHSSRLS